MRPKIRRIDVDLTEIESSEVWWGPPKPVVDSTQARQDRKDRSRVPISAADVARMMEAMGVDAMYTIDDVAKDTKNNMGTIEAKDINNATTTNMEATDAVNAMDAMTAMNASHT